MEKGMYLVIYFDFEPTTGNKTFLGVDSLHKKSDEAMFRVEEILEKYDSPELSVEIFSPTSIDSFKQNGDF